MVTQISGYDVKSTWKLKASGVLQVYDNATVQARVNLKTGEVAARIVSAAGEVLARHTFKNERQYFEYYNDKRASGITFESTEAARAFEVSRSGLDARRDKKGRVILVADDHRLHTGMARPQVKGVSARQAGTPTHMFELGMIGERQQILYSLGAFELGKTREEEVDTLDGPRLEHAGQQWKTFLDKTDLADFIWEHEQERLLKDAAAFQSAVRRAAKEQDEHFLTTYFGDDATSWPDETFQLLRWPGMSDLAKRFAAWRIPSVTTEPKGDGASGIFLVAGVHELPYKIEEGKVTVTLKEVRDELEGVDLVEALARHLYPMTQIDFDQPLLAGLHTLFINKPRKGTCVTFPSWSEIAAEPAPAAAPDNIIRVPTNSDPLLA